MENWEKHISLILLLVLLSISIITIYKSMLLEEKILAFFILIISIISILIIFGSYKIRKKHVRKIGFSLDITEILSIFLIIGILIFLFNELKPNIYLKTNFTIYYALILLFQFSLIIFLYTALLRNLFRKIFYEYLETLSFKPNKYLIASAIPLLAILIFPLLNLLNVSLNNSLTINFIIIFFLSIIIICEIFFVRYLLSVRQTFYYSEVKNYYSYLTSNYTFLILLPLSFFVIIISFLQGSNWNLSNTLLALIYSVLLMFIFFARISVIFFEWYVKNYLKRKILLLIDHVTVAFRNKKLSYEKARSYVKKLLDYDDMLNETSITEDYSKEVFDMIKFFKKLEKI